MEYTTISLPDATYRCSEVLTEEALNHSLRTPLLNVILNLNAIGNYIKNNEQYWINNPDEDPEEDPEGIRLKQPLIGINNINERPSKNNSILFYNGSWDFKPLSDSLEKLLSIKGTPLNNLILLYYDNNWRYTDLPTSGPNLSGLLNNLQNDGVDSSNKNGQNKILIYNNGTWSYREYNPSLGENVDLSNYTWWGQSISNNTVEGSLSGNIKSITFSDTKHKREIYLRLDNDGNLALYSSNGTIVNFYATGGVSSLGSNSGSGGGVSPSGGASLNEVWTSLKNATDNYKDIEIAVEHIPLLSYLPNTKDKAIFLLPSKTANVTYTLVTTDDLENVKFRLSPATLSSLGGIKVGKGLVVGNDGTLDVSQSWLNERYITNSQGSVTNDMLAGSIANAKLAKSSITIGSTTVSLGDKISASVLLNDLDDTFDGRYVTLGTTQKISGQKTFTESLLASNGIYLNKEYDQQWVNFDNKIKEFSFGQASGGDCVLYSGVPDDVDKVVNFYTNINGNRYALFIQGSTGNVGIGHNNPIYKFDVSGNIHTNSAYYLDDRLFANNDTVNNSGLNIGYGYAVGNPEKNQSQLPMALWGNGISFRAADGDTYGNCIKIDDTHGNITYGIMGKDFIGVTDKFRFEYDLQNNTVWVLKANGQPVNFASFGGVTSLGVGSSGTPNISSMNIASLTVSGKLTSRTAQVQNTLTVGSDNYEGNIVIEGNDGDDTYSSIIYHNGDILNIEADSSLDISGATSINGNTSITGTLYVSGTTSIHDMKVGSSGSVINSITWNTSTNRLDVKIGKNTYSFQPVSIT